MCRHSSTWPNPNPSLPTATASALQLRWTFPTAARFDTPMRREHGGWRYSVPALIQLGLWRALSPDPEYYHTDHDHLRHDEDDQESAADLAEFAQGGRDRWLRDLDSRLADIQRDPKLLLPRCTSRVACASASASPLDSPQPALLSPTPTPLSSPGTTPLLYKADHRSRSHSDSSLTTPVQPSTPTLSTPGGHTRGSKHSCPRENYSGSAGLAGKHALVADEEHAESFANGQATMQRARCDGTPEVEELPGHVHHGQTTPLYRPKRKRKHERERLGAEADDMPSTASARRLSKRRRICNAGALRS